MAAGIKYWFLVRHLYDLLAVIVWNLGVFGVSFAQANLLRHIVFARRTRYSSCPASFEALGSRLNEGDVTLKLVRAGKLPNVTKQFFSVLSLAWPLLSSWRLFVLERNKGVAKSRGGNCA